MVEKCERGQDTEQTVKEKRCQHSASSQPRRFIPQALNPPGQHWSQHPRYHLLMFPSPPHRTSRLDVRATTGRSTCPPRMGCKKAKLFAVRWRGARPSRNVSGPIIPANYVVSRRRFCPIGPVLCLLYIGGGPDPIKDNYRCLRRSAIILNDQPLDCFLQLTFWNGILLKLLS